MKRKLIVLACVVTIMAIIAVTAATAFGDGGIEPNACNALLQGKTLVHYKVGDPTVDATADAVYDQACINWPGPTLP